MLFYLDYIFTFSSLTISTKILEKRTRSEGIDLLHAPPPHRSIAQGVDQKMEFLFFIAQENLFIEGIHSSERPKLGASNVSQSGWKKGKDGSVTRNAFRTHALFHEEANPDPRLLAPYPFPFHRVKNPSPPRGDFLTLLPTSRLLSKESSLRKRVRLLRAFRRASTVPRPSREPSACAHTIPLPLVHTQVSHGKCQFAERTILACAIRARLAIDARLERERETSFVLRDTV